MNTYKKQNLPRPRGMKFYTQAGTRIHILTLHGLVQDAFVLLFTAIAMFLIVTVF